MSRIVTGRQPDFDIDFRYGHEGERWTEGFIEQLQRGTIEVKRKSRIDDQFYVEYECFRQDRWQPSGIQTTKAEFWVFLIHDSGMAFVVETRLLRGAFERLRYQQHRHKSELDGSHPTHGLLIEFGAFLNIAKKPER